MSEPSLRPFEGKVIAVTGAARGIGRAVAVYLGKRGASLAISDIAQQGLTEVAEELSAYSSDIKIQTTVVDVSKADQVQNWIEKTVKEFGRLDGAANIAGIARTNGLNLEAQEDATWDKVLNVNLTGTMYCLREEVKHIAEGGSIVNASSVLGIRSSVFAGDSAYVASKHGVLGLTRNAAREYGKKNIRVNCINPGAIDTPMMQPQGDFNPMDEVHPPIKRMGTPEEVAALVGFLLGDESAYITGTSIVIDGGLCC